MPAEWVRETVVPPLFICCTNLSERMCIDRSRLLTDSSTPTCKHIQFPSGAEEKMYITISLINVVEDKRQTKGNMCLGFGVKEYVRQVNTYTLQNAPLLYTG